MALCPTKAEDWVTVLSAETLDDNLIRLCTAVKLFQAIRGDVVQPSCLGVEFRIVVTNVGTDDILVTFYRTPEGNSDKREHLSMGSTHGDWDHELTGAGVSRSSRRIRFEDCGSGVTCGIRKEAGTTENMVVNVYARRDRIAISG